MLSLKMWHLAVSTRTHVGDVNFMACIISWSCFPAHSWFISAVFFTCVICRQNSCIWSWEKFIL